MTGSVSQGKTDSTYASVTEQAGIFAGKDGFDITVGKNTDLKGAVIASEATPDKNKISTDTLTYSDIQNKADYSASSIGVSISLKDGNLTGGSNPDIPATGNADSTTKSAISPGTIEVRSNPTQDISNLSRDPASAANALGKIFDKKTVQEQKELANVFSEVAFNELGTLAINNGWVDGGPEKTTIYAVLGGLVSQLAGGNFASGAASAGVNELFTNELLKIQDPNLRQLASYIVGSTAAKVAGGDIQIGGSVSVSETKNNHDGEHEILINGTTFLLAGVTVQIINGQKQLVVAGQAIATWASDTGTWIGNEASSAWDDFVIWASDGTPGNNQAQNKQARDAANKQGLNKEQKRKLHDEITGQN